MDITSCEFWNSTYEKKNYIHTTPIIIIIHKMEKKEYKLLLLVVCSWHCKNNIYLLDLVKKLQLLSMIGNKGCSQTCKMLDYKRLEISVVVRFKTSDFNACYPLHHLSISFFPLLVFKKNFQVSVIIQINHPHNQLLYHLVFWQGHKNDHV